MKKLIVLLILMLAAAGWQYRQTINRVGVEAKTCEDYGSPKKRYYCEKGWIGKPGEKPVGCANKNQIWVKEKYSCFMQFKLQCENEGGEVKKRNTWNQETEYFCAKGVAHPSPSPSPSSSPRVSPRPSPSVKPSPSPSPAPKKGYFVVHKFNDRDKDGVKDRLEVSTGRRWQFEYRVGSSGAWQSYTTNAFTGQGPKISVTAPVNVWVRERAVSGWTNSTPLTQVHKIGVNDTANFWFGNYRPAKPSPSPSPSPAPSPAPGQAQFVIRKFNDANQNGSWDNDENSTGKDWRFQYRLNDGDWHDYATASDTGWGGVISVDKGTKVEVKEIEESGWTNTTGLTLIRILDEEKTDYFDFGNFTSPTVVEASPPPKVPEAGAGRNFLPWLILGGLGVGLQVAALLL